MHSVAILPQEDRFYQLEASLYIQQIPLDVNRSFEFSDVQRSPEPVCMECTLLAFENKKYDVIWLSSLQSYEQNLIFLLQFVKNAYQNAQFVFEQNKIQKFECGILCQAHFIEDDRMEDAFATQENKPLLEIEVGSDEQLQTKLKQIQQRYITPVQITVTLRYQFTNSAQEKVATDVNFYLYLLPTSSQPEIMQRLKQNVQFLALTCKGQVAQALSKFNAMLHQRIKHKMHIIVHLGMSDSMEVQISLLRNQQLISGLKSRSSIRQDLSPTEKLAHLQIQADIYEEQLQLLVQEYEFALAKKKKELRKQQRDYINSLFEEKKQVKQEVHVKEEPTLAVSQKHQDIAESALERVFQRDEPDTLRAIRNDLGVKMQKQLRQLDNIEKRQNNDVLYHQQLRIKKLEQDIKLSKIAVDTHTINTGNPKYERQQEVEKSVKRSQVSQRPREETMKDLIRSGRILDQQAFEKSLNLVTTGSKSGFELGLSQELFKNVSAFRIKETGILVFVQEQLMDLISALPQSDLYTLNNFTDQIPEQYKKYCEKCQLKKFYKNYGICAFNWGTSIILLRESEAKEWLDEIAQCKQMQ